MFFIILKIIIYLSLSTLILRYINRNVEYKLYIDRYIKSLLNLKYFVKEGNAEIKHNYLISLSNSGIKLLFILFILLIPFIIFSYSIFTIINNLKVSLILNSLPYLIIILRYE